MTRPTLAHRAEPSDDVLVQEVGGEAVLLDLASESYFGLNPVGSRVWTLLGQDPSLKAAFDCLREEYEVPAEQLETDLLSLIEEMAKAGLVQVR